MRRDSIAMPFCCNTNRTEELTVTPIENYWKSLRFSRDRDLQRLCKSNCKV